MKKETVKLEQLIQLIGVLGFMHLQVKSKEYAAQSETLTIAINKIKDLIK